MELLLADDDKTSGLLEGKTSKAMARDLGISPKTVDVQIGGPALQDRFLGRGAQRTSARGRPRRRLLGVAG
ncbi:hypothetical protein [Piscinibacter sp.]|jgi:FixJ family two-component response regulator|uniref:hypothetical protein n=1 Tax=Piscinibacter sp. TaxID=1903157 RepID=UPI00355943D7